MKKFPFAFALLAFCFAAAFAQERTDSGKHFFSGSFKDKNSAVFAGISVIITNEGKDTVVTTDINGKFLVLLASGNYEVTVRKSLSETFKAFIVIQDKGLNPENVEFIIEPNPFCCGMVSEKLYPKIIKFPKPPYPAAARAVRATGEVLVDVKINKAGKVVSAEAVSGHPLLRAVSVTAAKQALFEPFEETEERYAQLTFVFLSSDLPWNEKINSNRYATPYRTEVVSDVVILNTETAKAL
jgi:TonB family protein